MLRNGMMMKIRGIQRTDSWRAPVQIEDIGREAVKGSRKAKEWKTPGN